MPLQGHGPVQYSTLLEHGNERHIGAEKAGDSLFLVGFCQDQICLDSGRGM